MAGLDRNAVQVGHSVMPEHLTPATWSIAPHDDGSRDNVPVDPTFCVAIKADGSGCAARKTSGSDLCVGHGRAAAAALAASKNQG